MPDFLLNIYKRLRNRIWSEDMKDTKRTKNMNEVAPINVLECRTSNHFQPDTGTDATIQNRVCKLEEDIINILGKLDEIIATINTKSYHG